MIVHANELEQRMRDEFPSKYRRFTALIDSGELWNGICAVMREPELLRNIRFCNDVMRIPPVKTHLMILASRGTPAPALTSEEKQSLGAAYGYLFKEVFGYRGQESCSCVIGTVKTAARYDQPPEEGVLIVDGD